MNLLIIGFGNVGQGFVSILHHKAATLAENYGFAPRIVGVATGTHGTLYDEQMGLSPDYLLQAAAQGSLAAYPDAATLQRDIDAATLVQQAAVDVVIEVSPSNYQTGQPALATCYAALNAHKHLVLANKGPVVVDYLGLKRRAQEVGRGFYFEGTVMAGTPSIRLALEALKGCTISRVRGILNGTTNYILTQMEYGLSYADALKLAQQQGYAEADPTSDVDGWDAAGKLIILAAVVFGVPLSFSQMRVQGITGISPANVQAAQGAGERWKLIAEATPEGASVQPSRLSLSDPLTGVMGATNAITYTTDLLGDVTLIGAGAGGQQTGFAILADLLAIHEAEFTN